MDTKTPDYRNHTTPAAKMSMGFFGSGPCLHGVYPSRDEFKAVQKLYGYHNEPVPPPYPPLPPPDTKDLPPWKQDRVLEEWEKRKKDLDKANTLASRTSVQKFMQAGADLGALRNAERDGLRLVFWLAKYLEAGEDPVKFLVRLMSDAGFDIDPADYAWAEGLDESAKEEIEANE